MKEDFLLRDIFNMRVIRHLSERIKKVYPEFNQENFNKSIEKELEILDFGDRSKLIRKKLKEFLPNKFNTSAQILIDSLSPELILENGKTDWDSFINVALSEYIGDYGLNDYDISMKALYEMTKRCSSESGIRPFIRKYPKIFIILKQWTQDKNVHVRRLVSEGTRPRLPLSSPLTEIKKDPSQVIELLEMLKDDPELYVRRSVANNLNDISKDNPNIVINLLKKWKINATKERQWVIKHALRTLFKQENKDALELMGYTNPEIANASISIDNPRIGESKYVEMKFTSLKNQKLMIDYVIHYMKANGKRSEKVFKMANKNVKKEVIILKKKHSFRQMTTRKHYPGIHYIELIINGNRYSKYELNLLS